MKRLFPYLLRVNKHEYCSGAILFVAVGAIAVLSILALGAGSVVLQKLKLADTIENASTSFYLADSAIPLVDAFLAADQAPQTVSLYDLRQRRISFGAEEAVLSLSDEESKVNIDKVPKEILRRIGGLSGNEILLDEIVSGDFKVKEELLLLDEMSQEQYDGVKDFVTTFGAGAVNINTAGEEAFLALGMDDTLIEAIRKFRAGDDGEEATEDDNVFLSTAEVIPLLEKGLLGEAQKALLKDLISSNRLSTTSRYVRFDMSVFRGKKGIRLYSIIVNLEQKKPVLWQEN